MSYELGEILTILDSVLGPHKAFTGGEYYYTCPFCFHRNPKMAVNVLKRKWHCWVCHKAGRNLQSLLYLMHASPSDISEIKRLTGDMNYEPSETREPSPLTLPESYKALHLEQTSWQGKLAHKYVMDRGLDQTMILRYRIGFCDDGRYKNRIIVPSYDDAGKLNYFVARSFTNDFMKYMNPPTSKNVVGFEDQINWQHPLVLTEGVFDAIMARRNAIPLFGTYIPRRLQEKIIQHNVNEVYLALDRDALKQTLDMAEKIMKQGVKVFVVNLTEKDPSDLGFMKTQELIKSATPLTFANFIQFKLSLL